MKWTVKRAAEVQTAFLLLTRLPAGKLNTYVPKLTDAAWAFPAVGFVVGAIIAGIYIITSQFMLPSFASAIFALIFGIFCTGAIHEDGLADCADGFGGGQNKEKKITIMTDSAIGSFGMLALIMVMGLRILMLSSLPSTTEIATGIIICAVISRFSMVGYLCFLPAAKQEGLGNQASADNISLVTGGVSRLTIDSNGSVTIPGNVTITGTLAATTTDFSDQLALILALG